MKQLIYIANIRLPTEKAHGIQIMKTCEALARQGIAVELIIPKRHNPITMDAFDFYSVEKNFTITVLPCWDLVSNNRFGAMGYWIEIWTFYRAVRKYLQQHPTEAYHTRDLPMAYWLSKTFKPLFYEIHTLPDRISSIYKKTWERAQGLVVISNGLKHALVKQNVSEKKILLARDAVDVEKFTVKESKAESRRRLQLPLDQKIVVYTGHLYEWKGAGTLAEAAGLLPNDIHVYLVGGTEEDVSKFKEKYRAENLHIVGWQKSDTIPYWLNAADVLVLPNSAKTSIGAQYTSPLKAFEYIAAGRPIVASNVPALNEILHDAGRVLSVEPDNAEKLTEGIEHLLSIEVQLSQEEHIDPIEREKELSEYSWEKRAKTIKDFIFQHE